MQATRARFAVVHWIRYAGITPVEALPLTGSPEGALSWKVGPDGPITSEGIRGPSDTWCGVAMYGDEAAGRAALGRTDLPMCATAVEHWQALLLPIAHRGECNHLDRAQPGLVYEPSADDPGGPGAPLFVITTAGFDMGPDFDLARVVHFRRHVDLVRDSYREAAGWMITHVFAPFERGADGVTMTIWRSDAEMFEAAYRPGTHRTQIDTHKRQAMCDRTSFTRCRMLDSAGTWHGRDPFADAHAAARERARAAANTRSEA
jgi:hypothetical protein